MKDVLGQDIRIGDIVVHGQSQGHTGSLSPKIVTGLKEKELRVQGYTDHYWTKLEDGEWGYKDELTLEKGGWTFPERVAVVTNVFDMHPLLELRKLAKKNET